MIYFFLLSLFVQLIESAPDPLDELTINVNIGGTDDTNTTVECGVKKKGTQSGTSRIYQGSETEVNEYPWIVRILRKDGYLCGGSIIADKWILTAAHSMRYEKVENLDVVIGEHDITTTTETQITKHVKPDLIIIHPDYIRIDKGYPDIALLRIPPIDLKIYTPVCLPPPGFLPPPEDDAWIYGWGGTTPDHESPSNVLKHAKVGIWGDYGASAQWEIDFSIEELAVTIFAGGVRGGADICHGDFGGPLSYSNPDKNGRHEQIGIGSFGWAWCGTGIPTAYTEVSALTSWIYDQIADNGGATFGTM